MRDDVIIMKPIKNQNNDSGLSVTFIKNVKDNKINSNRPNVWISRYYHNNLIVIVTGLAVIVIGLAVIVIGYAVAVTRQTVILIG